MDQTDAFLATTLPRLRHAETALHNGDAGPRMAMWSHDQLRDLVRRGHGRVRLGGDRTDLPASRRIVLRLRLLRRRGHRGSRQRRPRLHGRLRAHHRVRQRRPTLGVRAACHDRVPPRGRRVEGGAPSRRSVGINERRRGPPATRVGFRAQPSPTARAVTVTGHSGCIGRRPGAVGDRHVGTIDACAHLSRSAAGGRTARRRTDTSDAALPGLSRQVDEWTALHRSTC